MCIPAYLVVGVDGEVVFGLPLPVQPLSQTDNTTHLIYPELLSVVLHGVLYLYAKYTSIRIAL